MAVKDLSITALGVVSGRPPLSLIITAHPLLAASKLVLPKGSFHLEQTIEMLILFKSLRINLLSLKPKIFRFLCLNISCSLGSSP